MAVRRGFFVAAAAVSLALGLTLPIMRIDRLYFFTDTPSILGLIAGLWEAGEWPLAILICLFSVVFPIVKLAVVGWRQAGQRLPGGWLGRVLPHLSKWSMIDVMLVAIAIFAAKSSGLASVMVQPGLWFYAASALIVGWLLPAPGGTGKDPDVRS